MLSNYDHAMIAFYLLFMVSIGWIFRHANKNSSDYFRGGGKMLWWMAGSSAFMVCFSAVLFTGMAGKAFLDGSIVLTIYLFNFVGFLINVLWSARRFRQMRVDTPMEAVRDRYGPVNEQIFTWLQIPLNILYAGIWLYGLGVFLTAAFGMPLEFVIISVGIVVVVMAALGGAWAVVASDFIQVLTLMPITIVAAVLALSHADVGGVSGFLEQLPAKNFDWSLVASSQIVWLWFIAAAIQKFISTNNMLDASRYLCAKSSAEANKAAILGTVLNFFGPIIWFIPPLAAAIIFSDLDMQALFPELGEKAYEGAYVAMALETMPQGMIGILLCGIFAATMSSMDSGLNRNAGIFVKNFYRPVLKKNAGETHLLVAGKFVTVLFGILVILAALMFKSLEGLPIFDLMLQFGALIALPYSIPLVLGMVFKRVPPWAAWSTVLIGFCVSFTIRNVVEPDQVGALLGLQESMTATELKFYYYMASVLCNAVICSTWYISSRMFYKQASETTKERDEQFFTRMETPVLEQDGQEEADSRQRLLLGKLCQVYGGVIILMMFIPNPMTGRLSFVFCGGVIALTGFFLRKRIGTQ